MADRLTDFEPTGKQQTLLGIFQNKDYDVTVTDACKGTGITRETYYAWMRIEGFRTWWISEADRFFTLQKTQVFASIFGAATGKVTGKDQGSPQDRKLYLERFDKDYMPKSRRELEHRGAVPVDLKDMSTEELERQAHAAGLKVPIQEREGSMVREYADPEKTELLDTRNEPCPACTGKPEVESESVDGVMVCKLCKVRVNARSPVAVDTGSIKQLQCPCGWKGEPGYLVTELKECPSCQTAFLYDEGAQP